MPSAQPPGLPEAKPVDLDALVAAGGSLTGRVEIANRLMQLREMLWLDSDKGHPMAKLLIAALEVIAEEKSDKSVRRASGGLALFARKAAGRPVWRTAAKQAFSLMTTYLRSRKAAKRGLTSPSIDDLMDLAINACVLGWLWAGRGKRLTEQDVLLAASEFCTRLTWGHLAKPA